MGSSAFTSRHHIRRSTPALVAALLATAYLIVAPAGADLPAQLLRVRLFAAGGFTLWSNWWYGGDYLLGYSVLFPPLGWLLGARLLGALASVGTAAAGSRLAHDVYGDDAWAGATWLGAATLTELLSGRLTFALGLCFATLTALGLERRQPRWAAFCGALTALASPVAGLCVALAGAVVGWRGLKARFRIDIANGIAAISIQILLLGAANLLFPSGGYQPFAFGALWPLLVAAGFVLALRPGPVITAATILYAVGCLAAYAVHTPLGSNATRLGDLLAGPLVALILVPRRAWLLLALAVLPLSYLQLHDAVTDLRHGTPDSGASYYRPLIAFLRAQPGVWRVEVPPTAGHWESYWLAPLVPLARGWERQTDIAQDPLFYEPGLTAARYEAWLHALAVRYVAVADAAPDYSARAELAVIHREPRYLHAVRRLAHWTVYEVAGAAPLAGGAGRALALTASSLRLDMRHRGSSLLRVRWSPYWRLSGVRGCVEPAGGWTRVTASGAGRARLSMSFSPARIGSDTARCDYRRR